MIDSLQRDNDELKQRLDELNDKEFKCASIQTEQPKF
jgi:hypothetical protein